jgi:hypothetical protein
MSTHEPHSALSRRTAFASFSAAGLGLAFGANARPAAAQDDAIATHPIVGAWFVQNEPVDSAEVTYAIFHANGTYTDIHSIAGTGIGVWTATGDDTVALTFKAINTSFTAGEYRAGTVTVHGSYTVDADGQRYAGTYRVAVVDTAGITIGSFESTTSATRLVVEIDPASGTPDAASATPRS